MGSFEEIKMAVRTVIKLLQTKAMVSYKRRERGGKKREGESWGRPTDLE